MNTTGHTIRRTWHGGVEDITFEDFARSAIQDDQVACTVALAMLEGDDPYQWNPHEPEFYEEFTVIDREGLYAQLMKVPCAELPKRPDIVSPRKAQVVSPSLDCRAIRDRRSGEVYISAKDVIAFLYKTAAANEGPAKQLALLMAEQSEDALQRGKR